MSDLIEAFDSLIVGLENAVGEVEECQFDTAPHETPRRGTYRVVGNPFVRKVDKHDVVCDVYRVHGGEFFLRSAENPGRGIDVRIRTLVSKDHRGELINFVEGKVSLAKRVSGSYEIYGEVLDLRQTRVPAEQRFMEFIAAGNAALWNRWCAELVEGAILEDLQLTHANLANFDLCCAKLARSNFAGANLAGANLSGADLTDCDLTGANFSGADLFCARLPRCHLGVLADSGLVEIESVTLVD